MLLQHVLGDSAGRFTGVAEVRLPGFTFKSRPGKVAVSIRIVEGTFRVGPALLLSPDGQTRPVTFLGVAHIQADYSDEASVAALMQRVRDGIFEALIDGATEADLRPGQYLVQEPAERAN